MSVIIKGQKYKTLSDFMEDPNFLDEYEKEKINFEISLIGTMIEAREQQGITQKN